MGGRDQIRNAHRDLPGAGWAPPEGLVDREGEGLTVLGKWELMPVVLAVLVNEAFQAYWTWQTRMCLPSISNLISVMIRWARLDQPLLMFGAVLLLRCLLCWLD